MDPIRSPYQSIAILSAITIIVGTGLLGSFLYSNRQPTFSYEMRNCIPSQSMLFANETNAELVPRRRYAVISVGTEAKYSYWLPAVALTWKIRQGFTPILFLVQDDDNHGWKDHAHSRLILDLLAEFGIQHIYYLKPDPSLDWNHDRMTQLSRLYASMLPFLNDKDFLITSDVDLLPIADGDGQYYDSFDAGQSTENFTPLAWQLKQPILLFDLAEFQSTDDKWGYQFKEWALSNIGMTALRWRQILHLSSPILPVPMPTETIPEWYWDQQLISMRLETARRTGNIVWKRDVLVKSRTNANRIDRIAWPSSLSAAEIDAKFDSHLPRVPDTRGTYREIFGMSEWLLRHVLNRDGQGDQIVQRLKRFSSEFENAL